MLNFKPAFSHSSFTLIKRLFSSSLISAIEVISSAYLRLLLFLPAILSHMMYSIYKVNKEDDNKEPNGIPVSILNQSVALFKALTVAS